MFEIQDSDQKNSLSRQSAAQYSKRELGPYWHPPPNRVIVTSSWVCTLALRRAFMTVLAEERLKCVVVCSPGSMACRGTPATMYLSDSGARQCFELRYCTIIL